MEKNTNAYSVLAGKAEGESTCVT